MHTITSDYSGGNAGSAKIRNNFGVRILKNTDKEDAADHLNQLCVK